MNEACEHQAKFALNFLRLVSGLDGFEDSLRLVKVTALTSGTLNLRQEPRACQLPRAKWVVHQFEFLSNYAFGVFLRVQTEAVLKSGVSQLNKTVLYELNRKTWNAGGVY